MSERKTKKPSVTVVETPGRLAWLRNIKLRRSIAIPAAIVLIVVAAVTVYIVRQPRTDSFEGGTSKQVKKLSDSDYQWALNNSQASNDPKATVRLAEEQRDDSVTRQAVLAGAYANDKQYDKALAIYKELDAQDRLTSNFYAGGASIATQAGQKDLAIEYYQKAITKAKSEKGPTMDSSILQYEAAITALKK